MRKADLVTNAVWNVIVRFRYTLKAFVTQLMERVAALKEDVEDFAMKVRVKIVSASAGY